QRKIHGTGTRRAGDPRCHGGSRQSRAPARRMCMNGVHDMGGMQCMGAVRHERNEPVFHERWEGRVFALMLASAAWRKWNIDAMRFAIESIPPPEYLRMSYYEKWLAALRELLVGRGLVTRGEVENGTPEAGSS